jgi:hypothetical protein
MGPFMQLFFAAVMLLMGVLANPAAFELCSASPQAAIPTTGSGKATFLLPATNWHDDTRVSISLVINNAGAKTVHADGLARFFTIRLYHGSDPVIDLTGHCLKNWLEVVHGRTELFTDFTVAAGNETGTWDFIIPRSMFDLLDPKATMEDLATGQNSRIEFVYNGITAISPTAGTTIVSGTIDCDVITLERDPRIPLAPVLPIVKLNEDLISDVVASTANQKRKFNTGAFYRRILIIVEDNATTIARSNTIVTSVERIFSQAAKGAENWTRLRAENWAERPIIGLTTPRTGIAWYYTDPTHTLDQRHLWDLTKMLQAELSFTTGAAANGIRIWLVREQIMPANPVAQAEVQKLAAK